MLASIVPLGRLDRNPLVMARAVAPAAAAPSAARRPRRPGPICRGFGASLAPAAMSALLETQERLGQEAGDPAAPTLAASGFVDGQT